MTMIEPERVTFEEADKRGLGALLEGASQHPIAVDTDEGEVVMVPRFMVDEVARALGTRDDLYDAVHVMARMVTDDEDGHMDLEDFITELGLTDDEIEAADD